MSFHLPPRAVGRRAASLLAAAAVVAAASAGCTGGDDDEPAGPGSGSTAVQDVPLDLQVRVTRVSGALTPDQREALAGKVEDVVGGYLEAAFLGDYPRSDFADAFATFTPAAGKRAERDRALLTGLDFAEAESVKPAKALVSVSVLAPKGKAVGATARLDVTLEVDRGDAGKEQVHLTGRLLLTRSRAGWQIFGYDVARSTTPIQDGATQ